MEELGPIGRATHDRVSGMTAPDPTRRGWSVTLFAERLGIRYPIIQGPFGGGRSTVELAAAATNAGGIGSFGAHELDADGIAEVATGIRRLTSGPFALNLWVPLAPELEPPPTVAEYSATVDVLRPFYDMVHAEPPCFRTSWRGQTESSTDKSPPSSRRVRPPSASSLVFRRMTCCANADVLAS